jgi:membrane dipeptidase
MSTTEMSASRADPQTLALHRKSLVFDCLALKYVLDEPYLGRMREGGVDAINMTVASEKESWDETLQILDTSLNKIAKSPYLVHAVCAADIRAAKAAGKIAVVLGTQGAAMLDVHLWRLRILHRLGVRYFGPAYTGATVFGDGCGEFRDAGLSVLGRELMELANELNMIIDLSHCGHRTRADAAEIADHPVCTHSNAYSVNANDRNTRDETVRAIAAKGGVIGVCGLVKSICTANPTIEHMLDHLDYFVKLVGVQHVGLGLDFTEAYQDAFKANKETRKPPKWRTIRPDIFGTPDEFFTTSFSKGLESIALLPNFTQGLRERDYNDADIALMLGSNWLRHFEQTVG